MLIRAHRSTLEESMATVATISPTLAAVRDYLVEEGYTIAGTIKVTPYGYDQRTRWNTHLVTLGGCAVAMTDGALSEE